MLEPLQRPRFLLGIILLIAGLDISILLSKLPRLIGIFFIIIGAILIYVDQRGRKKITQETKIVRKRNSEPRLAEKFISKITFKGKLIPGFPIIGAMVIIFIIILNVVFTHSDIGSFDIVIIAFGSTLILYPWLQSKYKIEINFVFLFFIFLIIILIIPLWVSAILGGGGSGISSQGVLVTIFLSLPLGGILSLLGIDNIVNGPVLSFKMQSGEWGSIGIAASCAGIYSLGIFLSAYVAFILSEFSRFNRRIVYLLIVGVILTYLANLLRMTIIVLAGYYNGMGNPLDPKPFTLLWTHEYAGEIIFICWVALFWWLAFRYLVDYELNEQKEKIKNVIDSEQPTQEPIIGEFQNSEFDNKGMDKQ